MAFRVMVELLGDSRSLERAFQRSTRSAQKFKRDIDKAARPGAAFGAAARGAGSRLGVFGGVAGGFAGGSAAFAAGAGAAAVVQGLEASVNAASDLNEQISKSSVVFGRSAQDVKDWSATLAESFGISKREALGVASSFGALFRPLGLTGDQAATQSERLTELGADLASFYNTDVSDALDAIRSGIVGEAEPLRRYGVLLSETRVQQQALADTGKKHVNQLTAQEKALARIKIIFEDTQKAQGDFARTSEGLANQTRVLKANLDNLSTSLGTLLIPVVTDATGALNDFFAAAAGKSTPHTPGASRGGGTFSEIGQDVHNLGKEFDFLYRNAKKLNDLGNKVPGAGFLNKSVFKDTGAALFLIPLAPGRIKTLIDQANEGTPKIDGFTGAVNRLTEGLKKVGPAAKDAAGNLETAGGIVIPAGVTPADLATLFGRKTPDQLAQQRNTWFDQMIGRRELRAGLMTNLSAQIAEYQKIADLIQKQIGKVHDVTRQLTLKDQALQVAAQVAALVQQRQQQALDNLIGGADVALLQAETTKTLTDNLAALELQRTLIQKAIAKYGATKDLQLKLIQNRIDIQNAQAAQAQQAADAADQAKQEKLGWLEFAYERAQATKTLADDLKRATALLNFWKKEAATGKRTVEEARNVWRYQQDITNINKQIAGGIKGTYAATSTRALTAGLNLTRAQREMLEGRLAQSAAHGGYRPVTGAALGQPIEITTHVTLDGRIVATSVDKHTRRTHQRRGTRR